MTEKANAHMELNVPKLKKAYQTPEVVTYGTVADLTATNSASGNIFDAPFNTLKRS